MKESDQCDGLPGVHLTSHAVQSVTAVVERMSTRRIMWVTHLIFDELANATASLFLNFLEETRISNVPHFHKS